ncbi:MAG: hypothetical protein P1U89_18920 [Verrucomicrobiales bacterium]|nr:hypothetical protein [Verrucomicrobiales bacterium]
MRHFVARSEWKIQEVEPRFGGARFALDIYIFRIYKSLKSKYR